MKITNYEDALTRLFRTRLKAEEKDKWLPDMFIASYNKKLNTFYRRLRFYSSDKTNTSKYDFELIRAVPMREIMGDPVSEQHGRIKYLCPLHNEKTPSFVVYKDTNSWYCFGCGQGGSNIDFVMKRYNMDTKDAIAKLNNYI